MVTPKTSVQTFAAERDDLARRHYASQDLFARENTADKTASTLADEFTKAFSDALAARGYRQGRYGVIARRSGSSALIFQHFANLI